MTTIVRCSHYVAQSLQKKGHTRTGYVFDASTLHGRSAFGEYMKYISILQLGMIAIWLGYILVPLRYNNVGLQSCAKVYVVPDKDFLLFRDEVS